jgi:RimJ/RimL family protein N-acetyltransferase
MMDNILHIVPYERKHRSLILASQMNHILMDKDKEYSMDGKLLEENGLAFSGIYNDKIIVAGGMKLLWEGVAEGWVMANEDVWKHPIITARAIKKNFEKAAKAKNLKRVQTAIRSDFAVGKKFAKWLGLKEEGLMRRYGFDGSDQYMYARIF